MLRGTFPGVVGSILELIDPLLVNIKTDGFELFAKFNGQRQTDVAESNDTDNSFSVLDF